MLYKLPNHKNKTSELRLNSSSSLNSSFVPDENDEDADLLMDFEFLPTLMKSKLNEEQKESFYNILKDFSDMMKVNKKPQNYLLNRLNEGKLTKKQEGILEFLLAEKTVHSAFYTFLTGIKLALFLEVNKVLTQEILNSLKEIVLKHKNSLRVQIGKIKNIAEQINDPINPTKIEETLQRELKNLFQENFEEFESSNQTDDTVFWMFFFAHETYLPPDIVKEIINNNPTIAELLNAFKENEDCNQAVEDMKRQNDHIFSSINHENIQKFLEDIKRNNNDTSSYNQPTSQLMKTPTIAINQHKKTTSSMYNEKKKKSVVNINNNTFYLNQANQQLQQDKQYNQPTSQLMKTGTIGMNQHQKTTNAIDDPKTKKSVVGINNNILLVQNQSISQQTTTSKIVTPDKKAKDSSPLILICIVFFIFLIFKKLHKSSKKS